VLIFNAHPVLADIIVGAGRRLPTWIREKVGGGLVLLDAPVTDGGAALQQEPDRKE
jgi:hypothetical protein